MADLSKHTPAESCLYESAMAYNGGVKKRLLAAVSMGTGGAELALSEWEPINHEEFLELRVSGGCPLAEEDAEIGMIYTPGGGIKVPVPYVAPVAPDDTGEPCKTCPPDDAEPTPTTTTRGGIDLGIGMRRSVPRSRFWLARPETGVEPDATELGNGAPIVPANGNGNGNGIAEKKPGTPGWIIGLAGFGAGLVVGLTTAAGLYVAGKFI